jgi:Ser/Thr protein kinase RdoA (MazF antagonist)
MATTPSSVADLKKVAEGREAEMFDWGDGKLLRLLRPGFHAAGLDRELRGSAAAAAAGIRVPAIYERVTVDGRPGAVVERIPGKDLLTEIASTPWRVLSVGRACGELHARMNGAVGSTDLPETHDLLAPQLLSERVPPHLAEVGLRELESLPRGHRLCHNDFHPANVMRDRDGLVVIDWPNATRGDAHADFARSMLMLKVGEPPASMPWLIRFGANFARALLMSSYARAYKRHAPVDEALYERWLTVRAIHRLQDGIEEERGKLLRLIEERLRK